MPAIRAKRVLGSKTGGQQSPMPELNDPWSPPEWDLPDEGVRRGEKEVRKGRLEVLRVDKEEERRGVTMSSMSSTMMRQNTTRVNSSRIKNGDKASSCRQLSDLARRVQNFAKNTLQRFATGQVLVFATGLGTSIACMYCTEPGSTQVQRRSEVKFDKKLARD